MKAAFVIARIGIIVGELLGAFLFSNLIAATMNHLAYLNAMHEWDEAARTESHLGSYIASLLVLGVVTATSIILLGRDVYKGNLERDAAAYIARDGHLKDIGL